MQNQICKTRSEGSKEEWIRHQNRKKEQPPYPALHSQINNNRKKKNLPPQTTPCQREGKQRSQMNGRSYGEDCVSTDVFIPLFLQCLLYDGVPLLYMYMSVCNRNLDHLQIVMQKSKVEE